jgi:hypothetical protein
VFAAKAHDVPNWHHIFLDFGEYLLNQTWFSLFLY